MSSSITEIWSGLRDAGMPDVMLFLPDGTASRCHWDETALIGETRVALLGDQERKIVRVVPVESCVGIGVAAPKGIDTSCFRGMVQSRLGEGLSPPEDEDEDEGWPQPGGGDELDVVIGAPYGPR